MREGEKVKPRTAVGCLRFYMELFRLRVSVEDENRSFAWVKVFFFLSPAHAEVKLAGDLCTACLILLQVEGWWRCRNGEFRVDWRITCGWNGRGMAYRLSDARVADGFSLGSLGSLRLIVCKPTSKAPKRLPVPNLDSSRD